MSCTVLDLVRRDLGSGCRFPCGVSSQWTTLCCPDLSDCAQTHAHGRTETLEDTQGLGEGKSRRPSAVKARLVLCSPCGPRADQQEPGQAGSGSCFTCAPRAWACLSPDVPWAQARWAEPQEGHLGLVGAEHGHFQSGMGDLCPGGSFSSRVKATSCRRKAGDNGVPSARVGTGACDACFQEPEWELFSDLSELCCSTLQPRSHQMPMGFRAAPRSGYHHQP